MPNLRRLLSVLFIVFTITTMVTALYYSSSSLAAINAALKGMTTNIGQNAEEEVQTIQELEHEPSEEIIQPEPTVLASIGFPNHLNLSPQLLNHDFTKPPSA